MEGLFEQGQDGPMNNDHLHREHLIPLIDKVDKHGHFIDQFPSQAIHNRTRCVRLPPDLIQVIPSKQGYKLVKMVLNLGPLTG
jgi:hypothetical protein